MRKKLAILALTAVLAACGSKKELVRPQGDPVPPKPAFAETAPTSDELLAPDSQSRPERSDELLRRSQRREDDRFDLPPTD